MLASIGSSAKHGLLIKGGRYLESLARADVLLVDKTGTLTLGQPEITDVLSLDGSTEDDLLGLASSVERYSEHPVAESVREAAGKRDVPLQDIENFESLPGMGVRARMNGCLVEIGNRRLIPSADSYPGRQTLEDQGKTLLFVARDGRLAGILAVAELGSTMAYEVKSGYACFTAPRLQTLAMFALEYEPCISEKDTYATCVLNRLTVFP